MKVVHLNQSDAQGGAAVAAYRIHRCLVSRGVDSEMWVDQKMTDDASVKTKLNLAEQWVRKFKIRGAKKIASLFGATNLSYFNSGLFGSSWINYLNDSDADVIHLHWLGNEILSVRQLGEIKKPCVVTLHDEWLLGDGFHLSFHKPFHETDVFFQKLFLRHIVNKRKRYYNQKLGLVAPSRFMADLVAAHPLYRANKAKLIGHPISAAEWRPIPKIAAKDAIGVSPGSYAVLFSCFGGVRDTNKGFEDFCMAIHHFVDSNPSVDLIPIVIGHFLESEIKGIGIPAIFLGPLKDKSMLITSYCASDVVLVPSQYESFGLVAQEVCALGIPVVAYEGTGIVDFVQHRKNGYLAKKRQYKDLANGLEFWNRKKSFDSAVASSEVLSAYSPDSVAASYIGFYEEVFAQY